MSEFQDRVHSWMLACFGEEIAGDSIERNHRFLEEALELVQACGCTRDEAHQLVDYVFNRPLGEREQEVGGVMVTLAALCLAQHLDMRVAGETELARVWTKIEVIRAKQATKPKHSPLPQVATGSLREVGDELHQALKDCREACLYVGDDGGVYVSEDVVIPSDLFDRICLVVSKWKKVRGHE